MTKLVDHFVDNNGVLVNYIESLIDSNHPPLLYIPGMLGSAEQFTDLEAVIKALDIDQIYLMSYSMGVPYAVQAAIKYPQKLK